MSEFINQSRRFAKINYCQRQGPEHPLGLSVRACPSFGHDLPFALEHSAASQQSQKHAQGKLISRDIMHDERHESRDNGVVKIISSHSSEASSAQSGGIIKSLLCIKGSVQPIRGHYGHNGNNNNNDSPGECPRHHAHRSVNLPPYTASNAKYAKCVAAKGNEHYLPHNNSHKNDQRIAVKDAPVATIQPWESNNHCHAQKGKPVCLINPQQQMVHRAGVNDRTLQTQSDNIPPKTSRINYALQTRTPGARFLGKDKNGPYPQNDHDKSSQSQQGNMFNHCHVTDTLHNSQYTIHHSQPPSQYSQPTSHHSQPTVQHSQPTIHHSQPTVQHSQPTSQYSQPTSHHSQPTVQHSQPTIHHSQPTVQHSQPTSHHSQITIQHSQPTSHHYQRTIQHSQPAIHTQPDIMYANHGIVNKGISYHPNFRASANTAPGGSNKPPNGQFGHINNDQFAASCHANHTQLRSLWNLGTNATIRLASSVAPAPISISNIGSCEMGSGEKWGGVNSDPDTLQALKLSADCDLGQSSGVVTREKRQYARVRRVNQDAQNISSSRNALLFLDDSSEQNSPVSKNTPFFKNGPISQCGPVPQNTIGSLIVPITQHVEVVHTVPNFHDAPGSKKLFYNRQLSKIGALFQKSAPSQNPQVSNHGFFGQKGPVNRKGTSFQNCPDSQYASVIRSVDVSQSGQISQISPVSRSVRVSQNWPIPHASHNVTLSHNGPNSQNALFSQSVDVSRNNQISSNVPVSKIVNVLQNASVLKAPHNHIVTLSQNRPMSQNTIVSRSVDVSQKDQISSNAPVSRFIMATQNASVLQAPYNTTVSQNCPISQNAMVSRSVDVFQKDQIPSNVPVSRIVTVSQNASILQARHNIAVSHHDPISQNAPVSKSVFSQNCKISNNAPVSTIVTDSQNDSILQAPHNATVSQNVPMKENATVSRNIAESHSGSNSVTFSWSNQTAPKAPVLWPMPKSDNISSSPAGSGLSSSSTSQSPLPLFNSNVVPTKTPDVTAGANNRDIPSHPSSDNEDQKERPNGMHPDIISTSPKGIDSQATVEHVDPFLENIFNDIYENNRETLIESQTEGTTSTSKQQLSWNSFETSANEVSSELISKLGTSHNSNASASVTGNQSFPPNAENSSTAADDSQEKENMPKPSIGDAPITFKRELQTKNEIVGEDEFYKCGICNGLVFDSVSNLVGHYISQHAEDESIPCPHCRDVVEKHRIISHMEANHRTGVQSRFTCCGLLEDQWRCGVSFDSLYDLWKHMRLMHSQEKKLDCAKCEKRFDTIRSYVCHFQDVEVFVQKMNHITNSSNSTPLSPSSVEENANNEEGRASNISVTSVTDGNTYVNDCSGWESSSHVETHYQGIEEFVQKRNQTVDKSVPLSPSSGDESPLVEKENNEEAIVSNKSVNGVITDVNVCSSEDNCSPTESQTSAQTVEENNSIMARSSKERKRVREVRIEVVSNRDKNVQVIKAMHEGHVLLMPDSVSLEELPTCKKKKKMSDRRLEKRFEIKKKISLVDSPNKSRQRSRGRTKKLTQSTNRTSTVPRYSDAWSDFLSRNKDIFDDEMDGEMTTGIAENDPYDSESKSKQTFLTLPECEGFRSDLVIQEWDQERSSFGQEGVPVDLDELRYNCCYCCLKFTSIVLFRRHLACHATVKASLVTRDSNSGRVHCGLCDFRLGDLDLLSSQSANLYGDLATDDTSKEISQTSSLLSKPKNSTTHFHFHDEVHWNTISSREPYDADKLVPMFPYVILS